MKNLLGTLFLALTLSGCTAPKYSGTPIKEKINADIVIVNDIETREGFQDSLESWVTKHDFKFTSVPEGAKHDLDKITLEYVGYWGWDLAIFLKQADINAYYKGQRIGVVNYKAPNTFNTNKFGSANERIGYMMDILFGRLSISEANTILNPPPKKAKK